ncbi:hypothetical protein [Pantoea ananatis]|uniref:hypothetical protein n=1 Tax=Pantoea ananas TaxID=553 RepID=UPI000494FE46|nr:hypothetical protein [Pantoea ananatis]
MKRYDIPLVGNEYYYEGFRANIMSFVVALVGVVIYSVIKLYPSPGFTNNPSWIALGGVILSLLIIFAWTKKFSNRFYVFNKSKVPTYNPVRAKFWFGIYQLTTGVFCSFFFDILFSEVTLRLTITTLVFLFIFAVSLNGYSKNAVKISNLIE